MRHIKLHTDFQERVYESTIIGGFEKIETTELNKAYPKFVKFSEAKLKRLENFGKNSVFLNGKELEIDDFKGTGDSVTIFCDDDEWYYVSVGYDDDEDVYKCDQWDGLVNCLNSL